MISKAFKIIKKKAHTVLPEGHICWRTLFLEDDHKTERKEIACVFQHIWNDFFLLTKECETISSCKVMFS